MVKNKTEKETERRLSNPLSIGDKVVILPVQLPD